MAVLHLGIDAEKVVVAQRPLKMRAGRSRRRSAGSVSEAVPLPGTGRSIGDRVRFAGRLAMALGAAGAVFALSGVVPWQISACLGAAVVIAVFAGQTRSAPTGVFAVPHGDRVHVLWASAERAAFARVMDVARRIRRTWPDLAGMIDPQVADHDLTRALDELAALLARRQEIRRLRAELADAARADLPPGSSAMIALAERRDRVEQLWQETGVTANRMLSAVDAAALAGESWIREQRLRQTTRDADLMLSRITAGIAQPAAESGAELAERTAAVVAAYRELAAGV
ncbi:hypothetical protein [Mangrovihabitans endophyticus]|uniref:Uncharacterized protein n=1 Tax=Mangrovihabitans endophyticus TaxID=1751298 RepID=A0A8J3BZE4_9ACTN|nr:hypothetical protein [Mangrovihabitans endophyticus]GGK88217.1 hypothetical protein GCM10012284_22870 [Mangrovihabitans endophyticus]